MANGPPFAVTAPQPATGLPTGRGEFPETLPLELRGACLCSKGAADRYVRSSWRTYGLRTAALRQPGIYGGPRYATGDRGQVAYFVRMGVVGLLSPIGGTGRQVRDLLHVSDLCRLFRTFAPLPDGSAVWGEAF